MNKVITINLGGIAYQLEEQGYDLLRSYLEGGAARLDGNPDREEILSDIERAIGEKFRALLGVHKTVIETKEVTTVLAEMGPIEAESNETARPHAGAGRADAAGSSRSEAAEDTRAAGPTLPKRLYRIKEGAKVCGVCNGIAAYFNIDPTFVRLGFVMVFFLYGTGLLAYVILALVVPPANSPEEKAAATGFPSTAQEFIRRGKEGYYEAMKNFPDRKARREWKRRFRQKMRAKADYWREHWQSYHPEPLPGAPVIALGLPILSILHGAATLLWVCALASLLATGSIAGLTLPPNVPVWVAALLLLIVFGMLSAPLKMARRWCYRSFGRHGWSWSIAVLMDTLVWVAVFCALFWLALHFSHEFHEAVRNIPSLAHEAKNDVREWWKGI